MREKERQKQTKISASVYPNSNGQGHSFKIEKALRPIGGIKANEDKSASSGV